MPFTHPGNPAQPLGPWVRETQIGDLQREFKPNLTLACTVCVTHS
jgi:hypothetical protein